MSFFIHSFLDILYPRRCVFCDGLLGPDERFLCGCCREKPSFIMEPRCFRCGCPVEGNDREFCRDCTSRTHVFDASRAPFLYSGAVKDSIGRMKYLGRAEYAAFYGRCMALYGKRELENWKPEVLLPVPVHPSRLLRRGYNQAALLAEGISKETGIPVKEDLLLRRKKTKAMKELNPEERKRNLQKAFCLGKKDCPYKRVLLVDDIYTTGSTLDALAEILKENGVEEVYGFCACISRGR